MRLVANISLLFTELPITERFHAARDAGFDAVEILFPYDFDIIALSHAAKSAGMPVHLINTPPGNWDAGERGFGAIEGPDFKIGLEAACETARALGSPIVHLMAGNAEGPKAQGTLRRNLAFAADFAPDLTFLLEPLNPTSFPGYALSDFTKAAQILNDVNRANTGLQLDTFHAEMMGLDPVALLDQHADLVRHIQISSAPNRAEPQEDQLADLAKAVRKLGYPGAISAEYTPSGETSEGLSWLRPFRETLA